MFKIIEEFPDYMINEEGDVVNSSGEFLKKQVNIDGYFVVNLYKDGKYYHRRCGRMVGLTFLKDTYQKGYVINHKDLDKQNDHVSNLEWVSVKENNHHSLEKQPHIHRKNSDYTEAFIREVCVMMEGGLRNVDIVKKTGIRRDVLLHIRRGKSWYWVSKDYDLKPSRKGISEETARWVCYRLAEGLTYKEILSQKTCPHLTIDIVKKIKAKKSWTKISKHILKD